jgi:hypothetical protein
LIAAVAAAAIVCAASVIIGQALLRASGWKEWSPLAAGIGFAALLVICGLGGRVIALVVAVLGAAAWLVMNGGLEGGRDRSSIPILAAPLIAAVAASIPFLVNDRVGILGQGLVNDDMANHLLMADWAQNGTEPRPELIDDGYPLGPHSLAATLADLLGTGLVEAFAGLTLAIAALHAITALAALDRLPPLRRTLAAALTALPYLGAAYLAQGAFKEPIQALLLIAFALLLATCGLKPPTVGGFKPHVRLAVPLAVVLAAAIYNYSFPGLFWLAGAAGILFLLVPRPSAWLRTLGVGVALAALLTIPEWVRILEFTGFGAFDPAGEQTGLGNLRQAISPLEALGVWPSGEFRLAPADASIPAVAFYLAGLLGATAVGIGIAAPLGRRREDGAGVALVAALGSAVVIYLGAAIAGTPYTSAKALAIAAVPAMLLALRALLARDPLPGLPARLPRPAGPALAAVFVLAAAGSSFLVLRQAPVSPPEHPAELAQIREAVAGDPVLFLGRDDFIAWHLRGSPVSTHLQNFFSTGRVPASEDYPENAESFGFGAVSAETLDRFGWVLTSSSAYASAAPENFELAERTPSYALYRRTGPTGARALPPGDAGRFASLACETTLASGAVATTELPDLRPGTWEVSVAYDSPRPLELRISGPGLAGAELEVPGNLDFRGPTPPFPAEPMLEIERGGDYDVEIRMADPPLAGKLLGAQGEVHLRGLVAVSETPSAGDSGPRAVAPCPA